MKRCGRTAPASSHGWRAASPDALETAAARLEELGNGVGWSDGDAGHGRAYRFNGPGGHVEEIFRDVERYPEWNPFTVSVKTSFELGSPVDMQVALRGRRDRQGRRYLSAMPARNR